LRAARTCCLAIMLAGRRLPCGAFLEKNVMGAELPRVLVLSEGEGQTEALLPFAAALARRRGVGVTVAELVRDDDCVRCRGEQVWEKRLEGPAPVQARGFRVRLRGESDIVQFLSDKPHDLWLLDRAMPWDGALRLADAAAQTKAALAVVSGPLLHPVRRLGVACGGGVHCLEAASLARDLALDWGATAEATRVAIPAGPDGEAVSPQDAAAEVGRLLTLARIDLPIRTVTAGCVMDGLKTCSRDFDLMLLGATSVARMEHFFPGSVGYDAPARLECPAVIVQAPEWQPLPLAAFVSEDTVRLGAAPATMGEAVALLSKALAAAGGWPSSRQKDIEDAAMRFHEGRPGGVAEGITVVWAALPGAGPARGALGVWPGGAGPDSKVRVVFLLSGGVWDSASHLRAAHSISRLAGATAAREALLAAATPKAAMEALAQAAPPRANATGLPTLD